jgi:choline kinase
MVSVAGRPAIDWLVDTARSVGIDDLVVVTGYRGDVLDEHTLGEVRSYDNPDYEHTDMVHSLWCAEEALEGPVVISYSDILYTPDILERVAASPHDIAVAVDDEWRSYWDRRHDNPLEDAENLLIDEDGRICSIGQPLESMDDPDAQYVGLTKLSTEGVESFRATYREARRSADRTDTHERSSPETIHMTDILHRIATSGVDVHSERIAGGWVEIDTPRDLEIAREVCRTGEDRTLRIDRTSTRTRS